MVVLTLANPREKFWGAVLSMAPEGLCLRGIELASFEDLLNLLKDGEAFTSGVVFFPIGSEFASLMLSLATFGAGFLMRPIGAIVLGAYMDRHGRRAGLLLTLGMMAIGTLTIAALPGYATIGLMAPLLVLLGRLIQGLSAGV